MYIIYHNSYYLNCKQTSIAEIHLRFQGYVPVSPVVVYITIDECRLRMMRHTGYTQMRSAHIKTDLKEIQYRLNSK
jgi:hypothetical protein